LTFEASEGIMQLESLEAIQRAWEKLPGIAQDAYREVREGTCIDQYGDTIWRNVLWYLEQIESHLAPSDVAMRNETKRSNVG